MKTWKKLLRRYLLSSISSFFEQDYYDSEYIFSHESNSTFLCSYLFLYLVQIQSFFEVHSFSLSSLGWRHYWILGLVCLWVILNLTLKVILKVISILKSWGWWLGCGLVHLDYSVLFWLWILHLTRTKIRTKAWQYSIL